MLGAVLAMALGQAPAPDAVLAALGEDARVRELTPHCAYREVTTVEELNDDGSVKGSEVRRYDVEYQGTEVLKRERVDVVKAGEPLADLLVEQRNAKGTKMARSPLHPEAQAQYRFSMKDATTVTIEPREVDGKHVFGEAKLDAKGRLAELSVRPAKVPLLLASFSMRFVFGDTPCGRLAMQVDIEGQGVAVFVETRFRSRTRLEGHALVAPPLKSRKPQP